jgi:hypothetical protein
MTSASGIGITILLPQVCFGSECMRHAIETAPRDGEVVILENNVSGIYEVAHWWAGVAMILEERSCKKFARSSVHD